MAEDNEILQAQRITKTLSTDGGQDILGWVKKRIDLLTERVLTQESDITLGEIKTDKTKKTNITIINMNKDYEKHEIKVWQMFLKKITDWERMAQNERR